MPSAREFAINAAWLTVVMLAVDLLVWTQTTPSRYIVVDNPVGLDSQVTAQGV